MTTVEHTSLGWAGEAATDRQRIRLWSLLTLIAFVAGGVAFAGFLVAGGIWFTISDAVGLLQAIAFVPLILAFDNVFTAREPSISGTAKWVGLVGCGLVGVGSIVLLTADVSHEFVPAGGGLGMQFVGFGLIGVWLLLLGIMGQRSDLLRNLTNRAALATGVGFVVGSIGAPFGAGGVVTSLGFTVAFVGLIVWVVSIRLELNTP